MLAGFFDDSGKESNPREGVVCLAGYVAADANWAEFSPLWVTALMKHGISRIHMRDFIHLRGEYGELGWDVKKRDAALTDFLDIIKDIGLVGVGVAVDADAWRRIVPKELSDLHGNAMEFCFARVVCQIVERLAKISLNELLTMIFDCDEAYVGRRFNVFSFSRKHDPIAARSLASITFANPHYYVGLQAADILAWMTRKELAQKQSGHQSTAHFEELFGHEPGYFPDYMGEYWPESEIEEKVVKPWRQQRDILAQNANEKSKAAQGNKE